MKVVLYSTYFLPVFGGVQTNVFELARGLSEWQHDAPGSRIDVTVVTRTADTTPQDASWPFRVVRRPSPLRLLRLLRNADVIHVAGPAMLPMVIGLILRKSLVITHHVYQSVCPNGLLIYGPDRSVCPGHFMEGRYRKCLQCNSGEIGWFGSLRSLILQFPRRWLCKLTTVNVAITNHVARRIALPHTQTVLYGIRDPGWAPPVQNGHGVEIGYVGRLVPEKGVPILLNAAKRLHDDGLTFHLTIIGDGPLRRNLENEVRRSDLAGCVSFVGGFSGPDLERVVRPLQIVVMPSVWEETAGLSAIEQMMRGQVVVASDIGGLSEVVGDCGVKVAPGDPDALYVSLRQLLESPSLFASFGQAARARATSVFNLPAMIDKHVALYKTIVTSRATNGRHNRKQTLPGDMRPDEYTRKGINS